MNKIQHANMISCLITFILCLFIKFSNTQFIYVPDNGFPITVGLNNESCNGSSYSWMKFNNNIIPNYAIIGGNQSDDPTMYVGRIVDYNYEDGVYPFLPCKIASHNLKAYAAVNGTEISSSNFEFLVGYEYIWLEMNSNKSTIPDTAIVGGTDLDGKPMFIGRAMYQGNNMTIGQFTLNFKLIVSLNGEVGTLTLNDNIEILVAICDTKSTNTET